MFHDRSKRIEIRYHHLRDCVQKGIVKLPYIPTNEQITDILTFIFELEKQCRRLRIFGDSKLVINWFNLQAHSHVHTLRSLLEEIFVILKAQFDFISCHHIYRERNQISDSLSKEEAQQPRGSMDDTGIAGAGNKSILPQAFYRTTADSR